MYGSATDGVVRLERALPEHACVRAGRKLQGLGVSLSRPSSDSKRSRMLFEKRHSAANLVVALRPAIKLVYVSEGPHRRHHLDWWRIVVDLTDDSCNGPAHGASGWTRGRQAGERCILPFLKGTQSHVGSSPTVRGTCSACSCNFRSYSLCNSITYLPAA